MEKTSRIDELLKKIADLEQKNKEQARTIKDQTARIAELEALLKERDEEIADLKKSKEEEIATKDDEIDRLKKEIERLMAIINKPKEDKQAQTEISGEIEKQINDYPRLLKEIVALKQLLEKKNQRIRDLEEEVECTLLVYRLYTDMDNE